MRILVIWLYQLNDSFSLHQEASLFEYVEYLWAHTIHKSTPNIVASSLYQKVIVVERSKPLEKSMEDV